MKKSIKTYLILNWKTEAIRVVKSYPSLNPYEVAIQIKFNLIKPENDIPVLDLGDIEIPTVIIDRESAEAMMQASPNKGRLIKGALRRDEKEI